MEPPRPPPEMMDEVVEEILIRCPPDDPARLLRAALVCRRWCRIATDPGFRRRFIERHRTPPMLGFLCNVPDDDLYLTARFVPTPGFHPRRAVAHRRRAIDARHGRLLLHSVPLDPFSYRHALLVWDPVTDEEQALPGLPLHVVPWSWNAAVLCASGGRCDHLDCHRGSFLVLFVGAFSHRIVSWIFSSEAGAWGKPASFHHPGKGDFKLEPSVLVGNALHFVILFPEGTGILKYDLATGEMSVINLPSTFDKPLRILLMTTEDNGLGFAIIKQSKLYLWSREDATGSDGDAGWDQSRVIELEMLLPMDALSISPHVVGFAGGVRDILFLGTKVGYFTIDLMTSKVRKVVEDAGFFGIFPFISFYTPELGAATTGDRPPAGASTSSQA